MLKEFDECSFRLRTRRGRQRPAPLGPPPGRRTLSTVARPLNNLVVWTAITFILASVLNLI